MPSPHCPNPYAPPASTSAPRPSQPVAPRGPRSKIPLVLGILSIIFSSIFLLLVPLAITYSVLHKPPRKADRPSPQSAKAMPASAPTSGEQSAPGVTSPQKADPEGAAPSASNSASAEERPADGRHRAPTKTEAAPESGLTVAGALVVGLTFLIGTPMLFVLGIGQVRYRRWSYRLGQVWSVGATVGLLAGAGLIIAAAPERGAVSAIGFLFYLAYPVITLALITRPSAKAAVGRVPRS